MLKLNRNDYLDKLHACWLGKNIGGTMGAPYEGAREMHDIQGFAQDYSEPLPNDDLDLQLVWLCAMEDIGPKDFNANSLADYWLDWIPPHWNEYGICKTNLRMGLLPPMSGEVDNEKWRNSNGAWIRSEIWAALCPGKPELATKYAIIDARYDHGCGEGVYAEIFTAGLQSLAYVESDIPTLIQSALNRLPEDCMVAKTIRLVIDCHQQGISYREAREKVVEFNRELGWFQAPANIGFVIIGLLYGEGDYKKSMCYAINCGDDTDCTGATVGATLGIIGGTAAIPEDWKSRIGDSIVTMSVSGMYYGRIPKSCQALTERVYALVPQVMKASGMSFSFTEEPTQTLEDSRSYVSSLYDAEGYRRMLERVPYSYDVTNYRPFTVRVELDQSSKVSAGDERNVTLTFYINWQIHESRKLQMRLLLPNGWSCNHYEKTVFLPYAQMGQGIDGSVQTAFTVTVGEQVDSVNRVYAEITCPTMAYPVMVPIAFIG